MIFKNKKLRTCLSILNMFKFIMESVKLKAKMSSQKQDNTLVHISAMTKRIDKSPFNNETRTVNKRGYNPLVNISAMAEWTDKSPFNNETRTLNKQGHYDPSVNTYGMFKWTDKSPFNNETKTSKKTTVSNSVIN